MPSASDSAVHLIASEAWLAGALVTYDGGDGYLDQPACVQLLDVQSNPRSDDVNCVLSDRVHSIGAVLSRASIEEWRRAEQQSTWARLNGTIALPVEYEIGINPVLGQFYLRVHHFEWIDPRPRPEGEPFKIGSPISVMDSPDVRAAFAKCEQGVAVAQAARAQAQVQAHLVVTRAVPPSLPRVAAGPSLGQPASSGASTTTSCLQRLQRYALPMACAAFPVGPAAPHLLLRPLLVIPPGAARLLGELLGRDADVAAEEVVEEEADKMEETAAQMAETEASAEEAWPMACSLCPARLHSTRSPDDAQDGSLPRKRTASSAAAPATSPLSTHTTATTSFATSAADAADKSVAAEAEVEAEAVEAASGRRHADGAAPTQPTRQLLAFPNGGGGHFWSSSHPHSFSSEDRVSLNAAASGGSGSTGGSGSAGGGSCSTGGGPAPPGVPTVDEDMGPLVADEPQLPATQAELSMEEVASMEQEAVSASSSEPLASVGTLTDGSPEDGRAPKGQTAASAATGTAEAWEMVAATEKSVASELGSMLGPMLESVLGSGNTLPDRSEDDSAQEVQAQTTMEADADAETAEDAGEFVPLSQAPCTQAPCTQPPLNQAPWSRLLGSQPASQAVSQAALRLAATHARGSSSTGAIGAAKRSHDDAGAEDAAAAAAAANGSGAEPHAEPYAKPRLLSRGHMLDCDDCAVLALPLPFARSSAESDAAARRLGLSVHQVDIVGMWREWGESDQGRDRVAKLQRQRQRQRQW